MPLQSPTATTIQTASRSTQPFCQDADCGLTDRQTKVHCGTLRNVTERLRNVCRVLQCIAVHCGNIAEHFRTIVVRCRPLQCIAELCENVAEGLQTIVVLYGACGASSAPCGGVHHVLSPLAIIAVHYGNVTEILRTMGTLVDHYSALRCIAEMLWKSCGPLERFQTIAVHYDTLRCK